MIVYVVPSTVCVIVRATIDVNGVDRTVSISWLARFAATERWRLLRVSVRPELIDAATPPVTMTNTLIATTSSRRVRPSSPRLALRLRPAGAGIGPRTVPGSVVVDSHAPRPRSRRTGYRRGDAPGLSACNAGVTVLTGRARKLALPDASASGRGRRRSLRSREVETGRVPLPAAGGQNAARGEDRVDPLDHGREQRLEVAGVGELELEPQAGDRGPTASARCRRGCSRGGRRAPRHVAQQLRARSKASISTETTYALGALWSHSTSMTRSTCVRRLAPLAQSVRWTDTPAAPGDEAHDLVAGHRGAAPRQPHEDVVESFDVHADPAAPRPRRASGGWR